MSPEEQLDLFNPPRDGMTTAEFLASLVEARRRLEAWVIPIAAGAYLVREHLVQAIAGHLAPQPSRRA